MGKLTISMAIFNSKLLNYQRVSPIYPLVNGNSRIQYMEVRKRTIFLAIICGDIPWNLALKNRPYICIYGMTG